MMIRSLAPLAALALLLSACAPPVPCTECPDVSGTYYGSVDASDPDQSTCDTLYSLGWEGQLYVAQNGSALTFTGLFETTGVLYEDLLFSTEPYDSTTVGEEPKPVRITYSGGFSGEAGARTLSGTVDARLLQETCVASVPFRLTQE